MRLYERRINGVVGLDSYEKTLPVLFTEHAIDEEELGEENELDDVDD